MADWIWMLFGVFKWDGSRKGCIRWGGDCSRGRSNFGSECGHSIVISGDFYGIVV